MTIDVTDATFESEVIQRSFQTPVVVDLWASWCGPCKTLGPIIEKVCDATGGKVVLAKVDVDANPAISQAFQVQSIPAVYALRDGKVIDGFMGAYPEHVVQQFVDNLMPSAEDQAVASLLAAGDEASLHRALELEPGNPQVICALAELFLKEGAQAALTLLARIPEDGRAAQIAASARLAQNVAGGQAASAAGGASVAGADVAAEGAAVGEEPAFPEDGRSEELDALLDLVKSDEQARQQYLDILAVMSPEDPRAARYRKLLTSRLF